MYNFTLLLFVCFNIAVICLFLHYCYLFVFTLLLFVCFNITGICLFLHCCYLLLFFRNQMYIWNNIFFSLGFDVRDHYKDFGGDFAAYAAPVRNTLHMFN